jgi:ribosome-associated protein
MTEIEDDAPMPPSKSSRKRAAHALQDLGQQLVQMREAERVQLPLSETLREAIAEAHRLRSRGAMSRQLQYIGKLMRDEDIPAIEAALTALTDAQKARARLRR